MTTHLSAWQDTNKKRGKKQRSLLYELFILGELLMGPHHGYLLREILNNILGPYKQISWGTLYPLIHRLEAAGLVNMEAEMVTDSPKQTGREKQRNLYHITEAGNAYFQELINDPIPYESYTTEHFIMKLNYFDFITGKEQMTILQHHQTYLQTQTDSLQSLLAKVSTNVHIPEAERLRIKWVISFRQSGIDAETCWVEAALLDLRQGRTISAYEVNTNLEGGSGATIHST